MHYTITTKTTTIMNYVSVNKTAKNAITLQGVGTVEGTPANQIKVGSILMWNFGYKEVVKEITETPKTITLSIEIKGKLYQRKLNKNRLVCLLSE